MFKLPNNHLLSDDILNDAAMHTYLPKVGGIPNSLEKPAQRAHLAKHLKPEQFSFIINTKKNVVTDCDSINRWLGYDESRFTIKNYISILHPAHATVEGFYTIAIYDFFAKEQVAFSERMQLTYVSLLALKHSNGKYIYCKKETKPLQISNEGLVTAFANECTIVKDFNNEHYSFRIYNHDGQQIAIEQKIKTLVKKWFEKKSGFSVQELRILKRYATAPNTTSEMIANSFKIEKSTVSTYNKRILNKAENIFDYRFENAQKVADYFNSMHLI